jgi:hypothetical protein
MSTKHLLVVIGLAVFVLALLVIGFNALNDYEVLNKGRLLSYSEGFIYEILVFGKYAVYVEPEIRLTDDVFNAAILLGIAYISLTFGVLIYLQERPVFSRSFRFFATMSAGMFYLAADELLGIHESLGHNLQFLTRIPGVGRPDDFIITLYVAGGLAYLYCFRSVILQVRRSIKYFIAGFAVLVLAAIADLATLRFEEPLEIVASILFLSGVVSMGLHIMAIEEKKRMKK